MELRDAMSTNVLTVTPERSLAEVAREMVERNCGSAVVMDPEAPGPGIFSERDLMRAVAEGKDPSSESVAAHTTREGRFATGEWSLEQAAESMLEGGYRHLVVLDGSEPVGVVSMRDVVRHWAGRG